MVEVLAHYLRDRWEQALWLNSPINDDGATSAATLRRAGHREEVLQMAREDVEGWTSGLGTSARNNDHPDEMTRPEAAAMLGVSRFSSGSSSDMANYLRAAWGITTASSAATSNGCARSGGRLNRQSRSSVPLRQTRTMTRDVA